MSDDEIFVILEKCKGDLEFGTLENAAQGLVHFSWTGSSGPFGRALGDNPLKVRFKNAKVNQKQSLEKVIRFLVC